MIGFLSASLCYALVICALTWALMVRHDGDTLARWPDSVAWLVLMAAAWLHATLTLVVGRIPCVRERPMAGWLVLTAIAMVAAVLVGEALRSMLVLVQMNLLASIPAQVAVKGVAYFGLKLMLACGAFLVTSVCVFNYGLVSRPTMFSALFALLLGLLLQPRLLYY